MPDIVIPINKTVDISQGCLFTTLGLQNSRDQLIQGQAYAHELVIAVLQDGAPASLTGQASANFVRQSDSSTVTVYGTVSGNVVTIPFPSYVYAYTGLLTISVFVGMTAILHIDTTVRLGGTVSIIDPGNVLPNVNEVQQIALEAEAAAASATSAAANANAAAEEAEDASDAVNGVTASATTLSPGAQATASASLVSGAWKLTFGIPQGIQGPRGSMVWHGDAITGTSTTPTAYATGISAALENDLYVYAGTSSANLGNVYVCTQGGDASTALWAYMANWRGAPGAGNVSMVNGVQPDADGNVTLGANHITTGVLAVANGGTGANSLAGVKEWLRDFTVQGQVTDADTCITLGLWGTSSATTNLPGSQPNGILAVVGSAYTSNQQTGMTNQFFIPMGTAAIWRRSFFNTNDWSPWTLAALDAYPVGAIYLSYVDTSPASIFGGSWTQIQNRFLVGVGSSYAAGATGGEATHKLTVDELPSHSHNYSYPGYEAGGGWYGANGTAKGNMVATTAAGGGAAHENRPPYLAVYMWRRTA